MKTMTMINLKDVIRDAQNACEYAAEIADYSGNTYICDAIGEIAISAASIYDYDVIRFIADHVEDVDDAISEFGWDGCGNSLIGAGKQAQSMVAERELYDNLSAVLELYAAEYIRAAYKLEAVDAEAWEAIAEALEDIDNCDYLSSVESAVDDVLTAEAEEMDGDGVEAVTGTAILPALAA